MRHRTGVERLAACVLDFAAQTFLDFADDFFGIGT
jgi:hypothetical protein